MKLIPLFKNTVKTAIVHHKIRKTIHWIIVAFVPCVCMESNAQKPTQTLQKGRGRYKVVITNEDAYQEIARFRLERWSVYIGLSTLFLLLVGLTTALILFTPLKYYLPGSGYGNVKQLKEYRQLKQRADSLERQLTYQEAYWQSVRKILAPPVTNGRSRADTTQ
ncbi:MAG: hypothetical protein ACKO5C_05220 [Ferruginibacter sp.]